MSKVQHVSVWTGVLAVHGAALLWLAQPQPPSTQPPEVTWIEWAAVEVTPPAQRPSSRSPTPRPWAPVTAPATPSIQPSRTEPGPVSEPAPTTTRATTPDPAGSDLTAASPSSPSGATAARAVEEEVTLPNQSAAYLNNPSPPYPAISKRLGEQGRVVVRVLIDDKGLPQQAELQASSGHPRLDQAAVSAVMSWRYVPGRKAGKAQSMWFNVPITFDLKTAQDR